MRRLLSLTLLVTALMLRIAFAHPHHLAQAIAAVPPPPAHATADAGAWGYDPAPGSGPAPRVTVLGRDGTGQFHIDALVNGRATPFLVDTGADVVALSPDSAARLGIVVRPGDFDHPMHSASGTTAAAIVEIDRLDVSGKELRHVRAAVVQGLEINLLGQTALRQLGKVELEGDQLRIDPV